MSSLNAARIAASCSLAASILASRPSTRSTMRETRRGASSRPWETRLQTLQPGHELLAVGLELLPGLPVPDGRLGAFVEPVSEAVELGLRDRWPGSGAPPPRLSGLRGSVHAGSRRLSGPLRPPERGGLLLIQGEVELEHVHPRRGADDRAGVVGQRSMRSRTCPTDILRAAATRAAW